MSDGRMSDLISRAALIDEIEDMDSPDDWAVISRSAVVRLIDHAPAAPPPALTRETLGKALDRTFPEQRDGKAPHEYADLLLMNLGGTPPPAPTEEERA